VMARLTHPVVIATQVEQKNGGHKYRVEGDERLDPSRLLTSCSTIANFANGGGGDGLLYWAVDLALKNGKREAFKESNEEAKNIGSTLHAQIQEYISTGRQPVAVNPLFGAWYSSMHELGIEWLATEMIVYHPTLGYAGTVDAVGIVDGVPTLFDWKTTNGLDKNGKAKSLGETQHAAQVGGYWLAMSVDKYLNTSVPIPQKMVICYVLKDTLNVEWKYVDINAAVDVFKFSQKLHTTAKKWKLYEK
jgi:hypothetical protein